ncbi:MAG: hypothetical protein AAGI46_13175 [Planctomycetota bacterium]
MPAGPSAVLPAVRRPTLAITPRRQHPIVRYLFRGLIRETGRSVEGAVEAETAEDALTALSNNGIVTEDLTPAPIPIGGLEASARASVAPVSAGRAGPPPLPPGSLEADDGGIVSGGRPVEQLPPPVHPGSQSSDPIDRAFAEASQSVSFDAVAQRYKGKSVWVIDRDKIRRQVAVVVDGAIRTATADADKKIENAEETGDQIRESVASALKELFKDNRNIASQKDAAEAEKEKQAQQAQVATTTAVSSPQLEALTGRLEQFLGKAENVLTQLQVAARRVGSGGGGAAGFAPRRISHIPKPRSDEQNSVLMEIFKSNLKLRDNLKPGAAETDQATPVAD